MGPNVAVTIGPDDRNTVATLTDNGTLSFAAGDTVTLNARSQ